MASILERRNRDGSLIGYQAQVRRAGVSKMKTFTRKTDAERWAREIETDIERGVFVDRSEAERTSLGELLRRYRTEVTPDKRGCIQEAGHLEIIERDPIASIRLSQLGSADVAAFRDRMKAATYAPSTIVRRLNLIAGAINHARREWRIHLPENPASATLTARPRGADRKRDRRLVGDEEQRLFEQLALERHAAYLLPLARLAIETAARQGELCSLHWQDINLQTRVMTIRGLSGIGSKNGQIRDVPLSSTGASALANLPRVIRDTRVFPLAQNTLKVSFGRAVRRAKIRDLTFHDLRHEATSRLAQVYTNPLELMRVTGHETLSMLARYYHASAAELAKRLV